MLRNILTLSVVLACGLLLTPDAFAQCNDCGGGGIKSRIGGRAGGFISKIKTNHGRHSAAGAIYDAMTSPTSQLVGPKATLKFAARDGFSPHRVYSYSNAGLTASNVHAWNQQQMDSYAWHGGYKNWQYGTPTALVVPPTAGYQSSYAWGVGQTRSTPIHHQFGSGGAASVGGENGAGLQSTLVRPKRN